MMIRLTVLFILLTTMIYGGDKKSEKPLIQVALLLDTSNSMDGLINQAKGQLWKVVNELATAKRNGQSVDIQVALYEYGNSSISSEKGYVRQVSVLTDDLDRISEKLFGLRTNGGNEYCGHVIKFATDQLTWSKRKDALKVIFIAGNEPFTQGPTSYAKSSKHAISNGIVVNTIFCGSYQEGVRTQWKDGAVLADGKYININHNRVARYIATPQDKEIAELGAKLNKTYIAYGRKGKAYKARQKKQDRNASTLSAGSMVQRSMFKSKVQYKNAEWDLADAVTENKVSVEDMEEEVLPEEMKKMDKKERKTYVIGKSKERKEIQKKISDLSKKRGEYLAKKRKELGKKDTLDQAMIDVVHDLGKKKGLQFKK